MSWGIKVGSGANTVHAPTPSRGWPGQRRGISDRRPPQGIRKRRMKVLITGGAGFIGIMLARRLLSLPDLTGPDGKRHKIEQLVLFDVVVPDKRPAGLDERVRFVAGEIADQPTVARLIDRPDMGIFHLASVVS